MNGKSSSERKMKEEKGRHKTQEKKREYIDRVHDELRKHSSSQK
jgi:hypothetical protein